jgi:7,8-dihydropterin-6-yl-methyl-4-(beta-D-ribofuranosyl)aminobenzene 5'-phosphate synthase
MEEVFMVIGGTHLLNTSREQQEKTLEALRTYGVERIGVSHCTGMKPAGYLSEQLGPEKFFFNNAGTGITFPDGKMKVNAFEKFNV